MLERKQQDDILLRAVVFNNVFRGRTFFQKRSLFHTENNIDRRKDNVKNRFCSFKIYINIFQYPNDVRLNPIFNTDSDKY